MHGVDMTAPTREDNATGTTAPKTPVVSVAIAATPAGSGTARPPRPSHRGE